MLVDIEKPYKDVLSVQTCKTVEKLRELRKEYNDTTDKVTVAIIRDLLGEDFTEAQYDHVAWGKYGIIAAPGIRFMLGNGWIKHYIVESDMTTDEKAKLARERVAITYRDGKTTTVSKVDSVAGIPNYQQIVSIRDATAEDITEKKKTTYYHVVD